MADFNALEALINAYIKQNGVKAITGQVLNGVLRGMVSALGKGWTIADGDATPTTDPGTMTGPVAYIAHTAGTYEHFGNLVVNDGEVALLKYNEQTWTKEVIASLAATASVDGNVGTPSVGVSWVNGVLTFDFHNLKGVQGETGNTGAAAGFGTPTATVDANVGTPGVSVSASGPDTAKVFSFQFTNLKGEQGIQGIQGPEGPTGPTGPTGVTSVVVTVDNTSGNPACTASLSSGVLTLAFTGLKGAQGDTGSSVDYPFTIVNNLTTDDATQALSAAMGVQLEGEISQLEHIVTNLAGKFYGVFSNDEELPEGDIKGYAFVGLREPLNLFIFDGAEWTDTEVLISGITGPQGPQGEPGEQGIQGPPGVTSAVASVDSGTGVPSVEASLNGGVLTLIFHNLKGAQGDTGSSVSYPFTLVNNVNTNDATQALTAAMGKYLQDEIDGMTTDVTDADLDIADEAGNILVQFKDGEIETKNFNSEGVNEKLDTIEEGAEVNAVKTANADNGDYAIADENGRILVLFKDGHIKTKNFDSQKVGRNIRILAIGNSWTCDAFNYLGAVFNDVLGETADLHIGVCYEGAASLQTHYTNLVNNNTYTFYEWVNDGPSWGKSTKNINTILTLDDWDVIMFQQVSTGADDYSTYQPYLNDCMDLISERVSSPVKFGWNLIRRTMTTEVDWSDISDNAQRLLRETLIQFIVPCGTATENARTTSLDGLGVGGHLTYDGSHLQEGLPCLVETYAAALYFLSLFGMGHKGINGSTFRPVQSWIDAHGMDGQANGSEVGVTEANVVLAKKCATIAVNNPYVITDCSNL